MNHDPDYEPLPWEAWEKKDERGDEQRSAFEGDLHTVVHLLLAALTIIGWLVAVAVVVPALVNSQNDGGLILAVMTALGSTAAATLSLFALWRSHHEGIH